MTPVALRHPAAGPRRAVGLLVVAVLLGVSGGGCTRYKKLSSGGSVPEVVLYDLFGQDRGAMYYYELVRDSHDEESFGYEHGTDTYLVDKNIDAIQKLGNANYARLEGEAQVVELLIEVLIEDRSALARSAAAGSLTKLGLRLPEYPGAGTEDRGDRLLQLARAIDAAYGPDGRGRGTSSQDVERIRGLVEQVGSLRFPYLDTAKDSLKLFYGRPYLVNEAEPRLREAIDTALTKRMRALIRKGLEAAVEDPDAAVRADAIRGLKTLGDRGAVTSVLDRLDYETDWLVRIEIAEYLGRVGTREGVVALVGMLDDANASVRHKGRQALTRIAGADHGFRASAWRHWAQSVDPELAFGDEEDPADGGDDGADDLDGGARR